MGLDHFGRRRGRLWKAPRPCSAHLLGTEGMAKMASQFKVQVQEGFEARSSDGKRLGKVIAIHSNTFVIEKGFFFPKDYTVPFDEVREVHDKSVVLLHSQEELGIRGGFWDAFVGLAGPGRITSEHGNGESKTTRVRNGPDAAGRR